MSKTKSSSIGSIIKQYRILKDMTQEALAEKLDISYQQVQKYEYNKTIPPLDKLMQISKVLEIPMEVFFRDSLRHDLLHRIESDIQKKHELVEILKENPELQDVITFYSKHKSNLEGINMLGIMKEFVKTPSKKRDEFMEVINKISLLIN